MAKLTISDVNVKDKKKFLFVLTLMFLLKMVLLETITVSLQHFQQLNTF